MKHCTVGGCGIVVAADVPTLDKLNDLLIAINDVPSIVGIKIGFLLAMEGLADVANAIRYHLGDNVDIIYDHQKAGNDIPDMGVPFARSLKRAGVDAAILFPFAGPETQKAWTEACFGEGLEVLTGGVMTHPKVLVSEGGYIADDAVLRIYSLAAELGCRQFVVPGTKLDWVIRIREFLEQKIGQGGFSLHAPGFLTQGGDISECGKAAGSSFYPIVGRAIYDHPTFDFQRAAAMAISTRFLASAERTITIEESIQQGFRKRWIPRLSGESTEGNAS